MNIGDLPVWLSYCFLFIGIVSSVFIVVGLCVFVSDSIKELIEKYKYWHKRKHRFDKSPLAKCYCIDCENWHKSNEMCWNLGRCTGDSWFCKDAQPREKDPDSQ